MSTLTEIESAVDALPPPQQEELFSPSRGAFDPAGGTQTTAAQGSCHRTPASPNWKLTMPLTPTEALLDVNVLIASVFVDHVAHKAARSFVEGLVKYHTTPTTQGGFLRFATRPWKNEQKEEQPPRLTMAAAQAKLREFTSAEGHEFLPDDLPFTGVSLQSMQGHRQWTDAYLLHLARKHGLMLGASLESRMSNLDDKTQPVLFVVS